MSRTRKAVRAAVQDVVCRQTSCSAIILRSSCLKLLTPLMTSLMALLFANRPVLVPLHQLVSTVIQEHG